MDFFKDKVNRFKSFLSGLVLNKRFWFIAEIILVLVFILYVCYKQYRNLFALGYPDFDLSIFHQGIWLLSQFKEPFVTIRGLNLFGDHLSLINLAFVPAYWVFPSPLVILFAQTIALGAAGFLVYLISKKQLNSSPFAFFLSFVFFMYPAVHYLIFFNYHPVAFAVPLVLLLWYSYLIDNKKLALASGILLVLVQEEITLVLIGVSLYLWLVKRWKFAKWLFFLGLFSGLFFAFVVMPHLSDSGNYQYLWKVRGLTDVAGGHQSIFSFLSNNLITERNDIYLNRLLSPLSFLNILNPFPILFNPMFWVNITSDWQYQHDITYHYTSYLIGTIFISLIEGISLLSKVASEKRKNLLFLMVAVLLLFALLMNNSKDQAYFMLPNMVNIGNPALDQGFIDDLDQLDSATQGKCISVSNNILPFFSTREKVYLWQNPLSRSYYGIPGMAYNVTDIPDYVILLKTNNYGKSNFELLEENDYFLVEERGNLMVYQKYGLPLSVFDKLSYGFGDLHESFYDR